MLQTRIYQGLDWADTLAEPWQSLFAEAADATPFQSQQWLSAWWSVFHGRKRPWVISVWDDQTLVALWPLFRTRGAWSVLRPMGIGASDYLHPLVRQGYEVEGSAAILKALRGTSANLLDLHQIRDDRPAFRELASADMEQIEQATCLVLDLPPTYEEYLKSLGKSLRYDIRRMDKSALSSKAKIVFCEEFGVQESLDVFFKTHRDRWRKRGLPGAFVGSRLERFHRLWAESAHQAGMLWLSVLMVDGEAKGAIYAMRAGSTCFFYQSGFDPSASSLSPGTLLVAHTIRRAIEQGLTEFDFLRGDEPYKRRWQPQRSQKTYRLMGAQTGVRGSLGITWNRLAAKGESRVRARLEGRGLF